MSSNESERPPNKRPRPVVSCLECRNRKLKCNRCLPCDRCVRDGRKEMCTYAAGQNPLSNEEHLEEHRSKRRRLSTELSPDTTASEILAKFNELQSRVQQLEGTLSTKPGNYESAASSVLPETPEHAIAQIQNGNAIDFSYSLTRDRLSDRDTLAQFPDVTKFIDHLSKDVYPKDMAKVASDLRVLHDNLNVPQTKRTFHIYDNISEVLAHMERILPSSHACHLLIGHYFDYFEDCGRILHRATTWSQFRAYFDGPASVDRTVCVPQLLAVVSIASSLGIFPECQCPDLHGQQNGVGAYQLLRNYLDLLPTARWFDLNSIQTAVLTLKHHKSCSLNSLETWCWSGQISRRAMAAGIHLQNGLQDSNIFQSEIRKRLWHTVLEFELTFSIACDMPYTAPSWSDAPPLNIDDAQLLPGMKVWPLDKDPEEWTNCLCQHILAQSFNDRIAAYNAVSSVSASSYNTILQHTRHLEQIIHDLPTTFRLAPSADEAADTAHRLMAKMTFDFLLRRPLLACYAPYAKVMPADDKFKEARIPWIQGCTIGICFQDLYDPLYPMIDLPEPRGLWDYFYNVYGWDVEQYMLASCLELQRLQELDTTQADVPSPIFAGHALRAPVKVMGWSLESITKSLEDTIGPLSRRVGRHGAMLQGVVKWVTIIGSLRIAPTCSRWISIKSELQSLVSSLRGRFLINTLDQSMDDRQAEERMSDLLWLQEYLRSADGVAGGNTGS